MNEYDRLRHLAERHRENYPPGTRLMLLHMNDPFAPVESGIRGTVAFIDDMAQIHMKWDNGRTLPLNSDEDSFRPPDFRGTGRRTGYGGTGAGQPGDGDVKEVFIWKLKSRQRWQNCSWCGRRSRRFRWRKS